MTDTRENCWQFFIDHVRKLLNVGSALIGKGRKFPTIVNYNFIDLFHERPEEVLMSVSLKPSISQDNTGLHW